MLFATVSTSFVLRARIARITSSKVARLGFFIISSFSKSHGLDFVEETKGVLEALKMILAYNSTSLGGRGIEKKG